MIRDNEFEIKDISLIRDFIEEKNKIEKLRKQSTQRKIPVITAETAAVIESICFLFRPANILEIGCGAGFSTYFAIRHFLHFKKKAAFQKISGGEESTFKYTGIDLNRQRLFEAREYIKDLFEGILKEDIKCAPKLDFICGNAINIIPELKGGFDMVFIDAAKKEYPDYLAALEGKMADGCIILADNIFYSGKIFNDSVNLRDKNSVHGIREYIKNITDESVFNTVFINAGDGIAISVFKRNP